jgi:capsular exopolysaccharide synthesis family protein
MGVAVGLGLIASSEKTYLASAQVFVATSSPDAAALAQGNTFAQARVQSYTSAATSPRVTQAVVNQLGLSMTSDELAGKITADAPPNKVLVNIHVLDGSPERAQLLANAVSAQFVSVVQNIEPTSSGAASSPVKLTVLHPATLPTAPTSPRTRLDLAVGLLLGLAVGIGVAVLRETLDTRVHAAADLEAVIASPVLGVVPFDKKASDDPLAFRVDPHGPRAEAFRQLLTNLQFVDVDHPRRVIAVTSGVSGEGKSSTSINLAAGLADAGFKVCLVDADLRRPTIAKVLGLVADAGITSILVGKATLEDVLQDAGQNLAVLASGPVPPNPSELLGSDHTKSIVRDLASRFDFVILDSAPVLPVVDGVRTASLADATLLVVRADKATREQVRRSADAVSKVGATIAGVVLNMASTKRKGYDAYYQAEYRPRDPKPEVILTEV